MVFARGQGEGRRYGEEHGAPVSELAVELGKPQVVAHRQPDLPQRGGSDHDLGPWGHGGRFPVRLPITHLDVEEVNLPVHAQASPVRAEEDAGVVEAALGRSWLEHRATQDGDRELLGQPREVSQGRALEGLGVAVALRLGAHPGEVLWEPDELGASFRRFANELGGCFEVLPFVGPTGHLDSGDEHASVVYTSQGGVVDGGHQTFVGVVRKWAVVPTFLFLSACHGRIELASKHRGQGEGLV